MKIELTRRQMMKLGVCGAASAMLSIEPAGAQEDFDFSFKKQEDINPERYVKEARFYQKLEQGKVECRLCPRLCRIIDKERGFCGVRENRSGSYVTMVYGRVCALHNDPVEKKPLYHFLPGTRALSVATPGCNIECKFCQNWQISQFRPEQVECFPAFPKDLVHTAVRYRIPSIAFTYTEPVIFYEYMFDCALHGRASGVHSVMISNGYIQKEPMEALIPHLSAVKIDLKAFTDSFYKDFCRGELKPVLDTLELLRRMDKWVEIVVLILPGQNDGDGEIRDMCTWVVDRLGLDVPMHFTRFYPSYKIQNLPGTPINTLERIHDIAGQCGIRYAYIGNVPGHRLNHTFCHHCQEMVVRRFGDYGVDVRLKDGGACPRCGTRIPGIWNPAGA